MGLLKKIDPNWQPAEGNDYNKFPNGFNVGDVIDISDFRTLVQSGAAILVDEGGVEQPLPGQVFACPICYKGLRTLADFVAHVDEHKSNAPSVAPVEADEIIIEDDTPTAPEVEAPTPVVEAPAVTATAAATSGNAQTAIEALAQKAKK